MYVVKLNVHFVGKLLRHFSSSYVVECKRIGVCVCVCVCVCVRARVRIAISHILMTSSQGANS